MKRHIDDLAVFGGPEAFLNPLFVGRPNAIERARLFERLDWVLDNNWLTNGGPLTTEFEGRIAELANAKHCVATCNATAGLQLLARAAGLTGEIIMPSMTFAATAHALRWLNLDPVFCDIDPLTGCLDVAAAESAITNRTSAIVGVHLWGRACDVDGLTKLAANRGLALFFDAAHALGCTAHGQAVGSFGQAEVFSFHATKVVNAFEGGAVVTDDAELAQRMRSLQNFGIGLTAGHPAGGTNSKMNEACAAMGLTSLDSFPEVILRNKTNYELYRSELDDLPGVEIVSFPRQEQNNFQYVILQLDKSRSGISRDLLLKVLAAEQVAAKPYFSPPCHQLEPYVSASPQSLPHTERLADRVLALPTGTGTSAEDIRRVSNIIKIAVTQGSSVSSRWGYSQSAPSSPIGGSS